MSEPGRPITKRSDAVFDDKNDGPNNIKKQSEEHGRKGDQHDLDVEHADRGRLERALFDETVEIEHRADAVGDLVLNCEGGVHGDRPLELEVRDNADELEVIHEDLD